MSTHSPGPWQDKITDDGDLIVVIPPHEQFCHVLHFGDMENTEGEDHHNAALVAAAPDLLACCRAMLALHESGSWGAPPGEYLPALRAAVAQATEPWSHQ